MRQGRKNGSDRGARRRGLLGAINGSSRPDRSLPLDARLRAITDDIPPSEIAELWVFPPLPNRDVASEFLIIACYGDARDRWRIVTAHLEAKLTDPDAEEYEWIQRLEEHGVAPQGWVAGIPDRLLGRLADAGVPEVLEIEGLSERWADAIGRFSEGNGSGPANGNGHIDSAPTTKVVSGSLDMPSAAEASD